jgi:hypothetical protein
MWMYPYTLWLFVGVSVWFIVNAFITEPRPSLMALVIVATGIAAYRIWEKTGGEARQGSAESVDQAGLISAKAESCSE